MSWHLLWKRPKLSNHSLVSPGHLKACCTFRKALASRISQRGPWFVAGNVDAALKKVIFQSLQNWPADERLDEDVVHGAVILW